MKKEKVALQSTTITLYNRPESKRFASHKPPIVEPRKAQVQQIKEPVLLDVQPEKRPKHKPPPIEKIEKIKIENQQIVEKVNDQIVEQEDDTNFKTGRSADS